METSELSWVRILHAAPDLPGLDLYFDNAPETGQAAHVVRLSYGQISEYEEADSRTHHLRGFAAARHDLGPELLSAGLPAGLRPGERHTLIVTGRSPEVHALLLYDSAGAPAPDMARVRVVHAAPDAPPMDIGVTGEPPLFANVGLEEATPFLESRGPCSASRAGPFARPGPFSRSPAPRSSPTRSTHWW